MRSTLFQMILLFPATFLTLLPQNVSFAATPSVSDLSRNFSFRDLTAERRLFPTSGRKTLEGATEGHSLVIFWEEV